MVLNLNEENGDSNNVIDDNLPEMLLDCEDDVVEDDNLPGILLDRMYTACLRSETCQDQGHYHEPCHEHVRFESTTMSLQ
ncbi:hypothetical protein LXL04_039295 [Taraxacum kok-saghyz]